MIIKVTYIYICLCFESLHQDFITLRDRSGRFIITGSAPIPFCTMCACFRSNFFQTGNEEHTWVDPKVLGDLAVSMTRLSSIMYVTLLRGVTIFSPHKYIKKFVLVNSINQSLHVNYYKLQKLK